MSDVTGRNPLLTGRHLPHSSVMPPTSANRTAPHRRGHVPAHRPRRVDRALGAGSRRDDRGDRPPLRAAPRRGARPPRRPPGRTGRGRQRRRRLPNGHRRRGRRARRATLPGRGAVAGRNRRPRCGWRSTPATASSATRATTRASRSSARPGSAPSPTAARWSPRRVTRRPGGGRPARRDRLAGPRLVPTEEPGRPEQVFQLTHADLPAEFPPLLRPRQRHQQPARPSSRRSSGARRSSPSSTRCSTTPGCSTVTGSGGCGKTRLALQAAADRVDRHPDGIWYVELAGSARPARWWRRSPRCCACRSRPTSRSLDAWSVGSRTSAPCPHRQLRAPARRVGRARGGAAPRLSTAAGDDHEPSAAQPAGRGHVAGAVPVVTARPRTSPTVASLGSVRRGPAVRGPCRPRPAELRRDQRQRRPCRRDLRAARRHPPRHRAGRGPGAQRLGGPHRRGPRRPLPPAAGRQHRRSCPRQQTLLESIEWSHQLLEDDEQVAAPAPGRCSVAGSLSARPRRSPRSNRSTPYDVLDLLGGLVDRSLVVLDDELRRSALPAARDHQAVRPGPPGRGRRGDDRARPPSRPLRRPGADRSPRTSRPACSVAARAVLDLENDNLRIALVHAETRDDPRVLAELAFDLVLYWFQTARFSDGDHWLATAAERLAVVPDARVGRLLWGRGYLNFYFGNFALVGELVGAAHWRPGPAPVIRPPPPGPWIWAPTCSSSATRSARSPVSRDALELARSAEDRWAQIGSCNRRSASATSTPTTTARPRRASTTPSRERTGRAEPVLRGVALERPALDRAPTRRRRHRRIDPGPGVVRRLRRVHHDRLGERLRRPWR